MHGAIATGFTDLINKEIRHILTYQNGNLNLYFKLKQIYIFFILWLVVMTENIISGEF